MDPTPPSRRKTALTLSVFAITTVAGAVADLVTKDWVFDRLDSRVENGHVVGGDPREGETTHRVIDGLFEIRLRVNRGAVWGLFSGYPEALLGLSVLAVGFILYMLVRSREREAPLSVSLGLICAGALGNLWDRHFHDGVRDFLHFYWKDPIHMSWPTFNLADVFICIGVGLYLFLEIFASKTAPAARDDSKASGKGISRPAGGGARRVAGAD